MAPPAEAPCDRRERIADAALSILAEAGSRGLTHRAIDRKLALPGGSTSYYFRTRDALLAAANERLASLDARDAAEFEVSAAGIAKLLDRWLSPAYAPRAIARFELYLDAARIPGQPLALIRQGFVARAEEALRKAGMREPRLAAFALVALSDGLLLHTMLGTPPSTTASGLRRRAVSRKLDHFDRLQIRG